MQVEICETVEVVATVTVDLEHIMSALAEAHERAATDESGERPILRAITAAYHVLEAASRVHIARKLKPDHGIMIAAKLRKQAKLFESRCHT